jgi:hypothetical protein
VSHTCRFADLSLVVIDDKVHPEDWPELAALEFDFPSEVRSALVRASSVRCVPPYLFIELFAVREPVPPLPSIGTMVLYRPSRPATAEPPYDLYAVSTAPFRHLVPMARCPERPESSGPAASLVGEPVVQTPDGGLAVDRDSDLVVEHADGDNLWIRQTLEGWLGVSPTAAAVGKGAGAGPTRRPVPAQRARATSRSSSTAGAAGPRSRTAPASRADLVRGTEERLRALDQAHPGRVRWDVSPEESVDAIFSGAPHEEFDKADSNLPDHVEELLRAGRRVLLSRFGGDRLLVTSVPWRGNPEPAEPKSEDVVAWEQARSEERWRALPIILLVGALVAAVSLLVKCPTADESSHQPAPRAVSAERRAPPTSPPRTPTPLPRATPSPRSTPVPVLAAAARAPSVTSTSVVLMGSAGPRIPVYASMAPGPGPGVEVGAEVARGAAGVRGRKLAEVHGGGSLLGVQVEFADGTQGYVRASGIGYPLRVVRVRADDTLNVRTGRSHKQPKVTELPPGSPVFVLATHARSTAECARQSGPSKWWKVRSLDGAEGYVNCHFLGPF